MLKNFFYLISISGIEVSVGHVVFVFVISILLINFLVALFANAVSEVSSSQLLQTFCHRKFMIFRLVAGA